MMKLSVLLVVMVLVLGCGSGDDQNSTSNCFPALSVSRVVDLSLPESLELNITGNSQIITGGHRGIIVYNVNGSTFKAFDLRCPNNIDSCEPMTLEGGIALRCSCDNATYSILNGSPVSGEGTCFAKEYNIQRVNSAVLQITNF